jgi:hypothetical protein
MKWEWNVISMGGKGMHVGYWWEARRKEATKEAKHCWANTIKMGLEEI